MCEICPAKRANSGWKRRSGRRVLERDGVVGHDAAPGRALITSTRVERNCLADGYVMNRPATLASEERDDFVVQPLAVISSTAPNGSSNKNTFGSRTRLRADAHLHAAGQLLGVLALEPGEPDQ